MILHQRPTDYGIERNLWNWAILVTVIEQRWVRTNLYKNRQPSKKLPRRRQSPPIQGCRFLYRLSFGGVALKDSRIFTFSAVELDGAKCKDAAFTTNGFGSGDCGGIYLPACLLTQIEFSRVRNSSTEIAISASFTHRHICKKRLSNSWSSFYNLISFSPAN